MKKPPADVCPYGSGRPLAACCGRYLDGHAAPPDAEALMRSRYTAYVLAREPYLLATWHPGTRPAALHLDAAPAPRWLGLAVKRHEPRNPDRAIVEFVARYKTNGRAHKLHETSRFVCEDGLWYYVDGEVD
jgi:SEC-C motif-containing protein